MCLNCTQEHIIQTADNTIFYLAKGFEGLYIEHYRNPTKLLLTLKITVKTHVCLNHAQEHKHLPIVSTKEGNHSLKSVNFIFLE